MPANMLEIAAYLSPFCRNTRSGLKAAFVLKFGLVFQKKVMHTPIYAAFNGRSAAHGVCIPLHGCSDLDLLFTFEYEAEMPVCSYANLLHRAIPQRFIES